MSVLAAYIRPSSNSEIVKVKFGTGLLGKALASKCSSGSAGASSSQNVL
ncbi:hypothetical protein CASFOL_032648 [Castilleja foliolosa]|uniref:Uncharacterized protein n=1 Tax=Castilleja foliolosa TaxID=1961234 RepID=A0ABD3C2Q6_9LAMI